MPKPSRVHMGHEGPNKNELYANDLTCYDDQFLCQNVFQSFYVISVWILNFFAARQRETT